MPVAYIINFTDKHAWILNWPNHCNLLCISSLDAVDKLTYQSTAQTTIRATWIDSTYNLCNCHLHAVTNIMNFTWRTFEHLEMTFSLWSVTYCASLLCMACHNSKPLACSYKYDQLYLTNIRASWNDLLIIICNLLCIVIVYGMPQHCASLLCMACHNSKQLHWLTFMEKI